MRGDGGDRDEGVSPQPEGAAQWPTPARRPVC